MLWLACTANADRAELLRARPGRLADLSARFDGARQGLAKPSIRMGLRTSLIPEESNARMSARLGDVTPNRLQALVLPYSGHISPSLPATACRPSTGSMGQTARSVALCPWPAPDNALRAAKLPEHRNGCSASNNRPLAANVQASTRPLRLRSSDALVRLCVRDVLGASSALPLIATIRSSNVRLPRGRHCGRCRGWARGTPPRPSCPR